MRETPSTQAVYKGCQKPRNRKREHTSATTLSLVQILCRSWLLICACVCGLGTVIYIVVSVETISSTCFETSLLS